MINRLVIPSCGKQKADHPCPAAELYTGPYFRALCYQLYTDRCQFPTLGIGGIGAQLRHLKQQTESRES